MDIEKFISILQIISLICISVIFAIRMQSNVDKYILPKPKEECWGIFVFITIVIGILYFVFQRIYKRLTWSFYQKMYNL